MSDHSAFLKPLEAPKRPRVRRTSADHLRDALMALSQHQGQIVDHSEKSWASITFAGARHRVSILFAGEEAVEAGESFVAALPDHEFAIPGQLVADTVVAECDHRMLPSPRLAVICELLLLEDA